MRFAVVISTIVIAVGGAFGNYLRFIEQRPDRMAEFDVIPLRQDAYLGEERRFSDISYDVLKADTTTLRRYVGTDGSIYWLFIAYFASQKYGSQIHSPKHCLPGGGWKIERLEPYMLVLPGGTTKEINRVFIRVQNSWQLMFYWFETRSGNIRSEFEVKWDLMMNSLLLRPTDAAFVRLTVPFEGNDVDAATERAVAFLRTFHAPVTQALPFDN